LTWVEIYNKDKGYKMESKIILIDVDGTLVDYEGELPESATEAIRRARKNGHKVYICTGRSEAEVYDYIWDIGLDGMIGGNGSYVKDGDKVIMHQKISAEETRHIVDWLHSRGLEFYLECNSGLYGSENFEEAALVTIQEYSNRKGRDGSQMTVRKAFPDMIFGADMYRDDVNKVSFILGTYQDHLDSAAEFPDLKPGTWGGAGEKALFGDLGVKDIDKGKAIDILLQHIGASLDDTIAFGDAKVDIPMLEKCAIGVAVESGGDEIKAMADYVTDAVDEDGIYNAFKYLGLI
jgi:Cof subfamily protein (haloacid dehalogenase superfamily)